MADAFAVNIDFPRYHEIVDHHDLLARSLNTHFDDAEQDYPGATEEEIANLRSAAHVRIEQQSTAALVACLEAYFRIDYLTRKKKNLKDHLSRRLIKVFNQRKRKASLMEDIVKTWLKNGSLTHADYTRIDKAFKFRHWIAHGQYWPLKMSDVTSDYYEVATIVEAIMNTSSFHIDLR